MPRPRLSLARPGLPLGAGAERQVDGTEPFPADQRAFRADPACFPGSPASRARALPGSGVGSVRLASCRTGCGRAPEGASAGEDPAPGEAAAVFPLCRRRGTWTEPVALLPSVGRGQAPVRSFGVMILGVCEVLAWGWS